MKMQTFPDISLSKLSHDEIYMIIKRILNEWKKSSAIPPTATELITELSDFLVILQKVLGRVKHSELTKKIVETDEFRDRAYRLLCKKIRSSLDEFDENLVSAAESLMKVVKEFGVEIVEESYAEQTSQTRQALSKYLDDTYRPSIETLNLLPEVERVHTYNELFETVWRERTVLESFQESLPRIRPLRREMEKRLRLLIDTSEYLYYREMPCVPQSLFNLIDSEIGMASAEIKRRATKAKNKSNSQNSDE